MIRKCKGQRYTLQDAGTLNSIYLRIELVLTCYTCEDLLY